MTVSVLIAASDSRATTEIIQAPLRANEVQTHRIASAGDWAVRSHAPTLVVQYRSGALPAPSA
jgi:hypothetical protein